MPRFAHLTDLHLRPPGVLTLGSVDADRFVSDAVAALVTRHSDVDAVLVTGDVADFGEDEAYTRAAMLLSRFSAPVIVVPGNHDRTGAFREAFSAFPGFGEAPVKDKACHTHVVAGTRVVALDTSIDDIANLNHHGTLGADQLAWLDETLSASTEPVVIAMHHPPFTTGIGFMDEIGLTDAAAFITVLSRHSNVKRIVAGHVHRVIVGEVAGVPAMAIPGVAHQVRLALATDSPPELVMEPPAYAIHLVDEDTVVSHVGYVQSFGEPVGFSDMKDAAEPLRR